MTILHQRGRRALRTAIGVAVATISSGLTTNAFAEDAALIDALRLPPVAPAEPVVPAEPVAPAEPFLPAAPTVNEFVYTPLPFSAVDEVSPDVAAESVPAAIVAEQTVEAPAGDSVPLADYNALLERVDNLEASWQDYQEDEAKAASDKKKKSSWKMSGRVHLDNWYFTESDAGTNYLETGNPMDDPENRWDFRRIRMEISGRVPNNMLFRSQIDFNNPSNPEMKDAYIGWDGLPHNHTLLLGNQKRPLGMDHLNSSRHNIFIERPLAVETFNEDARRLGVCMYGYSDSEMFNWRYGAFCLENISRDGRYRGDFMQGGLYGRLAASPWYDEISGGRGYYHCALVGSANRTDPDGTIQNDQNSNEARFRTRPLARSDSRWWNTNRILGARGYQQFGYESVLNIGSLQITSEYFGTTVQRDPLDNFSGEDLTLHGGYIFMNYFLTGEHVPLDRRSGTISRVRPLENFFLVDRCCGGCGRGWGAWSLGARFDYLDLTDKEIKGGQGWATTIGMNWYWTAYSKVQTNYIIGSIADGGQGQEDPNQPFAPGIDGDFQILGFRYMIDF